MACVGNGREVQSVDNNGEDINDPGATHQIRAFYSTNPEGNRFSVTCRGGCITILKATHDCNNRISNSDELKRVKALCQGKEQCTFTPAPSFFGQRFCSGKKNTWMQYKCNHGIETANHVDGPEGNKCDTVRNEGAEGSRDFHSANAESNVFDLTCKGGCIRITKVIHDCQGKHHRMPTGDEWRRVRNECDGKEHCRFTPAPSFFGRRNCNGRKKTWMKWRCYNHRREIRRHKNG